MSAKDTAAGFGIGLALGAIVGLAIGFLYAPRRGEETQEIVRERARDIVDRTRGTVRDVVEKTKERAARLRRREPELKEEPEEKA